MKFICETCHTKYTISDEKVSGKVLKIKCRKCNAIIEVKDPLAMKGKERSSSSSIPGIEKAGLRGLSDKLEVSFVKQPVPRPSAVAWIVERTAEAGKSKVETVEWFVSIRDHPVGPLSAAEIAEIEKDGSVGPLSLVWREGMPDWVELVSCPALGEILVEAREARKKTPVKETRPTQNEGATPLLAAHLGRIGARLDAVRMEDKKPPAAKPHLVDIPSGYATSLAPPRPKSMRLSYVMVTGFFVAMIACGITVGWLIVRSTSSRTQSVVAEANRDAVEAQKEAINTALSQNPDAQMMGLPVVRTDSGNAKPQAKSQSAGGSRSATADSRDKKVSKEDQELLQRMAALQGEERTLKKRPEDTVDTEVAPGGEGLTEVQLRKVVAANKSSIESCYQKALRKSLDNSVQVRIKMRIDVGPSGIVTESSILSSNVSDDYLNQCITSTIRRWSFPTASKNSSFEVPFMFTPGG